MKLSNLTNVAFIRENVAVALDYGYYGSLQGRFPEEGSTVLFCDMGSLSTTLTVAYFTNVSLEL